MERERENQKQSFAVWQAVQSSKKEDKYNRANSSRGGRAIKLQLKAKPVANLPQKTSSKPAYTKQIKLKPAKTASDQACKLSNCL